MLDSLHRSAVAAGAMMCLIIAVPAVAVTVWLADGTSTDQSNWVFVAFLAVVVSYLLGGALAGRAVPHSPFINGAAATLLAFVVIQGVFIVVRLARGDDINLIALVFNALLASSMGTFGAWFGARRAASTLLDGGGEPTG